MYAIPLYSNSFISADTTLLSVKAADPDKDILTELQNNGVSSESNAKLPMFYENKEMIIENK